MWFKGATNQRTILHLYIVTPLRTSTTSLYFIANWVHALIVRGGEENCLFVNFIPLCFSITVNLMLDARRLYTWRYTISRNRLLIGSTASTNKSLYHKILHIPRRSLWCLYLNVRCFDCICTDSLRAAVSWGICKLSYRVYKFYGLLLDLIAHKPWSPTGQLAETRVILSAGWPAISLCVVRGICKLQWYNNILNVFRSSSKWNAIELIAHRWLKLKLAYAHLECTITISGA